MSLFATKLIGRYNIEVRAQLSACKSNKKGRKKKLCALKTDTRNDAIN